MPTHHQRPILLLTLLFGVSTLGCAGDLPPDFSRQDGLQETSWGDLMPPADSGPPNPDPDLGTPAHDSEPDPDRGTPDTGPTPDTGTPGVGEPCPCTNGLICLLGACRLPCTQPPTDPCNAISNCAANEACVPDELSNAWACLPAGNVGATCNETIYCPNRSACASVNGEPFICLPVCTVVGQACGTGGACLAAGGEGCLLCSKP